MEPYFTRVSCEIMDQGLPPVIEKEYLGYYESSWDIRTNVFIKNNLEKIKAALQTYPSEYCYYKMHYVPQPTMLELGTEEEKWQNLDEIAAEQRENTSMQEGILYCMLFQDRGKASSKRQRMLVINVEDNTPQAILAAIRYMAQFADKMKNELEHGSGTIPYRYRRQWKVDLAVEHKDLYDSAFDWLNGKNEMYFSQTILKYDEDSHRLWFVDNKGNMDEEFVSEYHDLLAQAYYLLVWNHPEGIKDSDLYCDTDDTEKQTKIEALKEEFATYYNIINPYKDTPERALAYARRQAYSFFSKECKSVRSTARSRIKDAFIKHETNRVNSDYAKKVAEYYAFNAKEGKIKVINRSTTILLPDSLMSDRLKKHNAEHRDHEDKQS